MPPAPRPLTRDEAADLSARFRWLGFSEASLLGNYGGPPLPAALAGQNLSIVVGDATQGRKYFNGPVGKCATCHSVEETRPSPAANLAHIASKYPDPKDLQDNMLLMSRPSSPESDKTVSVVVTFKDGRTMSGYLSSVSDFKVAFRDDANKETIIAREDGEPRVTLTDRLQTHIDLLQHYQDDDIHNLTAYLVTLK
jgi:cytochrome c oxidase cbb3-type subunit 3